VWERFQEDLKRFISLLVVGHQDEAREQLIDRVSEALWAVGDSDGQIFPVAIELNNNVSPDYTQMTIRSTDTVVFLYAFTNALAVLNVNIQGAEIRTVQGETYDTFLVTDRSGGKIVSEDRIQELRVAAALIKQFTHLLPRSPNPAMALRQFNALTYQMLSRPDWSSDLRNLESATVLGTLAELMGVSEFLWEDFLRMQHENLFPVLLDMSSLNDHRSRDTLQETIRRQLRGLDDHSELVKALNEFKDREMFRIDLRHITDRVGFRDFSQELFTLAEVVVEEAAAFSCKRQVERFGVPTLSNGQDCLWCICALGKCGGREMGFGSDAELIFVYEGEGVTKGPDPVENSRFFEEFVRTFLGTVKAWREGIFEIDLCLRPYGSAGALACTLAGFSEYYSEGSWARQFERMALVKLRPVAGAPRLWEQVMRFRDDFVYSGRPLDVANVLHLRQRQAEELVQRGAVSAKYSPGGSVDVEYYVQARQIAVGHQDSSVRVANTLEAIASLAKGGYIPTGRAEELGECYGFLRRLIDALRVVRGHARDLTIPPIDSREYAYLARRLQYESVTQLQDAIDTWMGAAWAIWEDGGSGNG
jgi:glutamate-ammonia-ligase adenylyltransferase